MCTATHTARPTTLSLPSLRQSIETSPLVYRSMQGAGDWDTFDEAEVGSLGTTDPGNSDGSRRRVRFEESAELSAPAVNGVAKAAASGKRHEASTLDFSPARRSKWSIEDQRRYLIVQGLAACGGALLLVLVIVLVVGALAGTGGREEHSVLGGSRFAATGGIRMLMGSIRGSSYSGSLGPAPPVVEESAGFNPIASLAPLTAAGLQRIAGGTTNPRDATILVAVTSCCDNFNLTSRLLRNLAVLPDPIHVVVVDDASVDGSPDRLGDLGIEVVENVPAAIAQGLTHSWNVAYRLFQANPRYSSAWIVNNDILVAPHSFTRLDSAAAQTDEPRIVSPMTDALGLGHNPRCSYQNVEEVYFEGANGTAELVMPDELLDGLPATLGDVNQWMMNNSLVSVDDVDPEYVLGYFVGFPRGISRFEVQPGDILPPTLLNTGQEDFWFSGTGAAKDTKRPKPAVARRVFVYHDKAATMKETGHDHKEPDMTWKQWNHIRDDPTFFHDKDQAAARGIAFAGGSRVGAAGDAGEELESGASSRAAAEAEARAQLEAESEEQLASDTARAKAAAAVDAEVAKAVTGPASGSPTAADLLVGQSGAALDDQVGGSASLEGEEEEGEDEATKMLRAAATGGSAALAPDTDATETAAAAAASQAQLAKLQVAADADAAEIRTQLSAAAAEADSVIAEAEHVAATSTNPAERAAAAAVAKEARQVVADATRAPAAVEDSAEEAAARARGNVASRLEARAGEATTRADAALSDAQLAEQASERRLAQAHQETADTQEELASMRQMLTDTELSEAKTAAQLSDTRLAILDEEHKAQQEREDADAAGAAPQGLEEGGMPVVSQGLADVDNVIPGPLDSKTSVVLSQGLAAVNHVLPEGDGAHAGGIHSNQQEDLEMERRAEAEADAEVDKEAEEAVAAAEALEGAASQPAVAGARAEEEGEGEEEHGGAGSTGTTSLADLLRSLDASAGSDGEAVTLAAKLSRPSATTPAEDEDLRVIVDAASEDGALDTTRPPGAPPPPPEPNHSPKRMTAEEREHAEKQFLGLTNQIHSEMEQSHSEVATAQSSLEKSIGEVQAMMASMDHSAERSAAAKAEADSAPLKPLQASTAADTVKEAEEELAAEPTDSAVAAAVDAAETAAEGPDKPATAVDLERPLGTEPAGVDAVGEGQSSVDGAPASPDGASTDAEASGDSKASESDADVDAEIDAAISGKDGSKPLTAEDLIKEAEAEVGDGTGASSASTGSSGASSATGDMSSSLESVPAAAEEGPAGGDAELQEAESMLNDIMSGSGDADAA